ncbi:MAG: ABC transporter family substrate-binding protein [Acidimicrobiales bacterium]
MRRKRLATLWREYRARWTLPLVIIVIIGLVAIVDHLGSNRISEVDEANSSVLVAAGGGQATVELDRPWSGLNPNTAAGAASSTPTLMASVLPSAYNLSPKLVPQVNSDLLLSVEATSTSPLVIQYTINPRAIWSDGVPVSADDFIYAWHSQRGDGVDIDGQPDQIASTLGYRDVDSITSSHDGRTVTVSFSTPFTDWRVMFDHLVPAHIARRVGWNRGFDAFNPSIDLSAGPFVLQSVSPEGHAVLVRNPRWWGTPAALDRVGVTVAPDQAAWTSALASGNRTVAQPQSFDLGSVSQVTSMPNAQSEIKPSLNLLALEFNVTAPTTARLAARQAIAHAIDRTDLLEHTFGPIDASLVINQDHLALTTQSSYNPSSVSAGYDTRDLDATDRLLRSLGYHEDAAGKYVDGSGAQFTVRMAVDAGDAWTGEVGSQISSQLRAVGIAVDIIPVDGPEGLTAAAAADSYDMALVTRTASPYLTSTANWYSGTVGATGSAGSEDWSNYDDPSVDQLFIEAAEALNPTTGQALYGQIDDQLWSQMVALPLFGEPALVANGVQITNVQYNASIDGILWNLATWETLKPGPAGRQT